MLLACALAPAETDLSAAVERMSEGAMSWDPLRASAAVNKIRPQLSARLSGDPLRAAVGRAAADLGAVSRAIAGRGMFMSGELARVLDALRKANIPAVPFKGPAFAAHLGEEPGSREMADLDVFVRATDVAMAAKALLPLAFTPLLPTHALASPWLTQVTSELPLMGPADSTMVELHWETSPRWYPAPCTARDVMGQLTESTFFGCPILWPAPEVLFLLHVADGMKSCGCGIRWIADIAKIMRRHPDLDWIRIRQIAARNGGLNSVRVALCALDGLAKDAARALGIPALAIALPTPAQVLADEAKRAANLTRAVQAIRVQLQHDAVAGGALAHFLWALRLADRPIRTAGAIARHLSGPTVADLATMPPQGESNAALRLRALLRRCGRLVR